MPCRTSWSHNYKTELRIIAVAGNLSSIGLFQKCSQIPLEGRVHTECCSPVTLHRRGVQLGLRCPVSLTVTFQQEFARPALQGPEVLLLCSVATVRTQQGEVQVSLPVILKKGLLCFKNSYKATIQSQLYPPPKLRTCFDNWGIKTTVTDCMQNILLTFILKMIRGIHKVILDPGHTSE